MSCIISTSMIAVCIHLHNKTNTKCKMAVSRSHNNDLLQPLIKKLYTAHSVGLFLSYDLLSSE